MEERMLIRDLLTGRRQIEPVDEVCRREVKGRWDKTAKPLDSLGRFEELTAAIGAAQRTADIDIQKKTLIVMCADNGIVEEGISQSGPEVTRAVSEAMGKRCSNVCKMAAKAKIEVCPVDIGIAGEVPVEGLLQKKVRPGTRNFAKEPAMTAEETVQALQVGMDVAMKAIRGGSRLLCIGEMGIGNTTTSAAVAAALLHCPAETMVGRGAGLDDGRLQKKVQVVSEAIGRYQLYRAEPLEVLAAVGGLDIAGMAGVIIGGACGHVPVVLDGVISCVAALLAVRLFPKVRGYLLASHQSKEPAAAQIIKELGLSAVIDGQMALGEGTGAVMLCTLLDLALTLYEKPLTFGDIQIDSYTRFATGENKE